MSLDRLSAAWASLLNGFLGRKAVRTIDACALYWGVVAKQSGNKVDVTLDSKDIASPTSVPLYLGFPGSTVTLQGGERVLVGFRNGDPTQPYAMAFEAASTLGQILLAANDNPQPAARYNDTIHAGQLTGTVMVDGAPVPVTFTYTPATLAPPVTNVTAVLNGGVITGGSNKVGIGG